jgi:hypothetical protein
MSATTTTVRVRKETREALNTEVTQSGTTADAVIAAGLRALRRERLRREWERDARLAGEDAEDRAEVAAAIRDLAGDDE